MRKLLFLFAFIACFQLSKAPAQIPYAAAPIDTLTNVDTSIFTVGSYYTRLNHAYLYAWYVFADSLTGVTAGRALLQEQLCTGCSDWVTIDSIVINGVTTTGKMTGTTNGRRQRLFTTMDSTATTAIRAEFIYKKNYKSSRRPSVPYATSTDTMTNADTLTFTTSTYYNKLNDAGIYSFHIHADSLSGATAGTATLYEQASLGGSDWLSIGTVTINGVTTSARLTGTVTYGRRYKVETITTGTQSTALRQYFMFKKNYY